MTRPRIAIDIDDTIADSTETLRLVVNEQIGVDIQREAYRVEADYWRYYERVWEAHGIAGQFSHDQYADEMAIDQSRVPLLPGALLAIKELAKDYSIILLTARDKKSEQATRHWLNERFGDLEVGLYFSENHKDQKAKTKGELCRDLGASLLIDDNIGHCQSAVDQGVEAILFGEYGWHVDVPSHMTHCKDWQAVLEHLNA